MAFTYEEVLVKIFGLYGDLLQVMLRTPSELIRQIVGNNLLTKNNYELLGHVLVHTAVCGYMSRNTPMVLPLSGEIAEPIGDHIPYITRGEWHEIQMQYKKQLNKCLISKAKRKNLKKHYSVDHSELKALLDENKEHFSKRYPNCVVSFDDDDESSRAGESVDSIETDDEMITPESSQSVKVEIKRLYGEGLKLVNPNITDPDSEIRMFKKELAVKALEYKKEKKKKTRRYTTLEKTLTEQNRSLSEINQELVRKLSLAEILAEDSEVRMKRLEDLKRRFKMRTVSTQTETIAWLQPTSEPGKVAVGQTKEEEEKTQEVQTGYPEPMGSKEQLAYDRRLSRTNRTYLKSRRLTKEHYSKKSFLEGAELVDGIFIDKDIVDLAALASDTWSRFLRCLELNKNLRPRRPGPKWLMNFPPYYNETIDGVENEEDKKYVDNSFNDKFYRRRESKMAKEFGDFNPEPVDYDPMYDIFFKEECESPKRQFELWNIFEAEEDEDLDIEVEPTEAITDHDLESFIEMNRKQASEKYDVVIESRKEAERLLEERIAEFSKRNISRNERFILDSLLKKSSLLQLILDMKACGMTREMKRQIYNNYSQIYEEIFEERFSW